MTPAEFWATKSKQAEYLAIVFDHPEFASPIRLVANQYAPVNLGTYEHTPAPMEIRQPDETGEPLLKLTVTFPRAVVGREFKRRLKDISASGRLSPIQVMFRQYLGYDLENPVKSFDLYAAKEGGIVFTADAVQVSATDVNPMRFSAAEIYDPAVYTGLVVS